MKYPYAFKNGDKCCKTNREIPRGGSPSEIASGTCDGSDFNINSTCCIYYDEIKCPGDSCIDNKEMKTTNSIMTSTTKKHR